MREHGARAAPDGYAVAVPDVLAQLHAGGDGRFVAVASLEVASHVVGASEGAEQSPRRVAVGERAVGRGGEYGSAPQRRVVRSVGRRARERLMVAQEARVELLLHAQECAVEGAAHVVAAVVFDDKAHSGVERVRGLAVPQPRFLEVLALYIVDGCQRTGVEMVAEAPAVVHAHLRVEIFIFRLIGVHSALLVAYAPEFCGYAREVHVVGKSPRVAGEDVRAAHAHLEVGCRRGIEIDRHLRHRCERVAIGMV